MPTYQYKCNDCEIYQDDVRGINDPEPKLNCDTCGKLMNKVYSIGAVTFNGSGFYSKDK